MLPSGPKERRRKQLNIIIKMFDDLIDVSLDEFFFRQNVCVFLHSFCTFGQTKNIRWTRLANKKKSDDQFFVLKHRKVNKYIKIV